MAFSFSKLFKGKPGSSDEETPQGTNAQGEIPAPVMAPAPAAPPPAVRTVLPTSAPAPVSLRAPGAPSPSTAAKPPVTRNLPVRPPARKVSFPVPPSAISVQAPAPTSVPPPPIAMSSPPPPTKRAPAPAAPLPEAPDVAVNLEVGDFIDRIPPGFLNGDAVDRNRVIEFRASELYSDLAKGKASVPASTIYAKCPEIFARAVSDEEDAEIQLPLQKLVEQLSSAFTTRKDQVAEENVGEIETPFLQVANEDNARLPKALGTSAGAIRPAADLPIAPPTIATASNGIPQRPAHRTGSISTISAKPAVEPPPAPSIPAPPVAPINPGKRPPSTVRASVAGGKIRLSAAAAVTRIVPGAVTPVVKTTEEADGATPRLQPPGAPSVPSSASPSHQVTKKTARIQIPPISLRAGGQGATPRPGSIPPPPVVPVQPSPVSIRPPTEAISPIAFRTSPPPPPAAKVTARSFTPPPSFAPPRPTFPPPAFPAVPPGPGGSTPTTPVGTVPAEAVGTHDDRRIELGLAAVLRGQPSAALAVEPSNVPDDVRLVLPFAMIERQLGTGRVLVPLETFVKALPEAHRHVLATDSGVTEVQIPLQEVFQNLPGNALSIRQDQISEEVADIYPTPFAQKAEEDAQRLGGAVAPVAPPSAAAPEVAAPEEPVEAEAPVEEAEPEVAEESFGSIFEEEAPAVMEPIVPFDQPVAEDEALAVEDRAPVDEPARALPLDLEQASVEEESLVLEEEPTAAAVTDIHPLEAAVEPPAAIEPSPVEEALAVLESTAPGEDEPTTTPFVAPAAVEAPTPLAFAPVPAAISEPEPVQAKFATVSKPAPEDSELQAVFMTEDELDAKAIVRHVCLLPGITGCAVMFADGLRLAGNFPDGDAEGFSAMAPPFFKRTGNFANEALLGRLQAVTLHTDKALVSFFMYDDICLSVRHTGRGFLPGVREKLGIVVRELARMYSSEKSASSGNDAL